MIDEIDTRQQVAPASVSSHPVPPAFLSAIASQPSPFAGCHPEMTATNSKAIINSRFHPGVKLKIRTPVL